MLGHQQLSGHKTPSSVVVIKYAKILDGLELEVISFTPLFSLLAPKFSHETLQNSRTSFEFVGSLYLVIFLLIMIFFYLE
jgi:hypothetical protein